MKTKHKTQKSSASQNAEQYPRTDYLAVMPGVLMCLITLLMVLMDISMPDMESAQYESYPNLFGGVNFIILMAGISFVFSEFILHRIRLTSDSVRPPVSDTAVQLFRKTPMVFFGLFIILIFLSTAVNGLDDKALHGVPFRNIGVFTIVMFILFYMWMAGSMKDPALRRFTVLLFAGTSDAVATAALFDRFVSPIPAFGHKKDLSAIFFNGNHYGYFLVMAVLISTGLFLYSKDRRIRVFGAVSTALNLIILAMNGSTGCIIAAMAGLLLSLVITVRIRPDVLRENLSMLALVLVSAAAYILIGGKAGMITTVLGDISAVASQSEDAAAAGHNRWLLWTETWKYVMRKPLLGYGCEGLSDVLMDSLGRANPHNEVLNYAAQFGIPAAICYTAGVLSVFASFFAVTHSAKPVSSLENDAKRARMEANRKSGKNSSDAHTDGVSGMMPDEIRCTALLAAFGYFISSFFGVPMFYTLPFFFIFLGMV